MTDYGWAVAHDGQILLKTVSDTRRAALVNWIYVYGRTTVLDGYSDELIEQLWNDLRGPRNEVLEVEVTARRTPQ